MIMRSDPESRQGCFGPLPVIESVLLTLVIGLATLMRRAGRMGGA